MDLFDVHNELYSGRLFYGVVYAAWGGGVKLSKSELNALKDMTPERPYFWKPATMIKLFDKGLVESGHDPFYGKFYKINELGKIVLKEHGASNETSNN